MSVWVVTGPSGAGKATALRALEGAGLETVDNLPPELLPGFVGIARTGDAAAVIDARHGERLGLLSGLPGGVLVLFLDARDDVLARRAAESTRPHPCAAAGSVEAAIRTERALLEPLRAAADLVIDTSELTPPEAEARVRSAVLAAAGGAAEGSVQVTVSSFGHKFGAQTEADWVLDARLVRNPFWVDELRPLTGLDSRVREYVIADPASGELVRRGADLLAWALARYEGKGRRYLHIAVGCTGGRHRSVVLAEALALRLRDEGVGVTVRHRDVEKPDPRDG